MGPAIAGLLILGILFTGALMLFRTTLFGDVLISNAMKDASQLSAERARTIISINDTTGDTATLTVEVMNAGSTTIHPLRLSLVDYSIMDIIVQFPGLDTTPRRLAYTESSPPGSGEWTKSLISTSDKFEPGIFNPGETMIITAKLPDRGMVQER